MPKIKQIKKSQLRIPRKIKKQVKKYVIAHPEETRIFMNQMTEIHEAVRMCDELLDLMTVKTNDTVKSFMDLFSEEDLFIFDDEPLDGPFEEPDYPYDEDGY